jgi:hypothetical protein
MKGREGSDLQVSVLRGGRLDIGTTVPPDVASKLESGDVDATLRTDKGREKGERRESG